MRMQRDELDLRRLARVKAAAHPAPAAIGPELLSFFKQSVQKRQTKLSKLAECWERAVPSPLLDHCALEGFHRGTLTVIVDSASHLYDLKQLLLAGLEQQMKLSCASSGLKKIALRQGRWYDGDGPQERKVQFDAPATSRAPRARSQRFPS